MPYYQGKKRTKKNSKKSSSAQNQSGQAKPNGHVREVETVSQIHLTNNPLTTSALYQFQSASQSSESVPYIRVSIQWYHNYVNSKTSFNKPWQRIVINPYALPGFFDQTNTGALDLSVIFEKLDVWAQPKFIADTGKTPETAEGRGISTFMFLGGIPARPSGIDARDDGVSFLDDGYFQPHRRLITPSVIQSFKHVAHFNYLQLQSNQQQLISVKCENSVLAPILTTVCCIDPDEGESMSSQTDISIKLKFGLTYRVPLWLRGLTKVNYLMQADPTTAHGDQTTNKWKEQLVFPRVLGVVNEG